MVIVHVLSSFGTGGQERVAVELAEGQVAAGHRVLAVSLAAPPDGPEAERFRAVGADIRTLPKRAGGFDAGLVLRLSRLLSEQKASVVHTHNPQPLIYGAPAARLAGAALVHTKHGANPDALRRRVLRQITGHMADAYVAVSPATAEIAQRGHECRARRLRVIENGVDVARFRRDAAARRELRRELGIPDVAWVTGTVGRLAPEKDHTLLLDAIAPTLDDLHRLVIVGSGPEEERLRVRVSTGPAARWVHLTGARSDVQRLLSAFDVFVLSSKTEGLPLVIPEAMAASLPVVSTAVGGIASVVRDGETGLLVPAGNVAALRSALSALRADRRRASAMGDAACRLAHERYSKQRMVSDYLALYQAHTNGARQR
jgi:glycosyltransferase involved in cell wall biosynthesis